MTFFVCVGTALKKRVHVLRGVFVEVWFVSWYIVYPVESHEHVQIRHEQPCAVSVRCGVGSVRVY